MANFMKHKSLWPDFFFTFAHIFQHHLMKDYLFSISLPLLLSKRSVYYMCVGLFLALFSVQFICSFFFPPIADCIHHCSLQSGSVNPPALNFLNIMMATMPFCFWYKLLNKCTDIQWRRKWQPTPVFLPGRSQGRRSLLGCRLWGRTESDTNFLRFGLAF